MHRCFWVCVCVGQDGQEDDRAYDDSSVRRPAESADRHEVRSERDYDDRRSDYADLRSDYDDRRNNDDRRKKYSDRNERYDDRRNDDDRYDEPYEDRDDDRPPVPANKPPSKDFHV